MITPELIAKFRIALDYIDALGLHGRHVGDLINHAPALLDEIERLREENALQHSQLLEQAIDVLPERDAEIERLRARVAELETEVESSRKVGNTRIRQIKVSPAKIRAAMERAAQNSKTWVVWKDQKWKANDKVEDNYDHDNLA